MGDIGNWFHQNIISPVGNLVGVKNPSQTAEKVVAPLPTGPDLGTDAEPAGYTSAGGRRHRKGKKTMRGGKRHRKTHKARKH